MRQNNRRDEYHAFRLATIALFLFIGFSAGILYSRSGFDETITSRDPVLPKPSPKLASVNSAVSPDHAWVSNANLSVADLVSFELLDVDHDGDRPRALLRFANGSFRIVSEGDTIPSGLEVTKVYASHLLLRRTHEMLRLTRHTREFDKTEASEQSVTSQNVIAVVDVHESKSNSEAIRMYNDRLGHSQPPEEIHRFADNQVLLERDFMLLQMDSPQIFREALMEPVEGKGFEFMAIKPGSLYDHLGFRVGDVISEVNGEPIRSISDALALRAIISETQEVKVRLLRENSDVLVNYFLY